MHRTVLGHFAAVLLVLVGCPSAHDPDSWVVVDGTVVRIDGGPIPGCEPLAEMCNGLDEDCDRVADEGSGRSVGCAPGERCSAGDCVCPTGSLCGERCVDLESSFSHCGSCGHSCAAGEACIDGGCCLPDNRPVDLLFLVDNSNSMTEEQNSLAEQLPLMVGALVTGDVDRDGEQDHAAVTSLQVGVITTDMGTAGHRVTTCNEPNFGDDGVLRTQGNTALPGCVATYPSFLSYRAGDDPARFAGEMACVAVTSIGGCGFEQQLEAILKALTPSTSTITFWGGTHGHADGANAGFLRPNSVLAVITLTDEEDCSASNPDIFNPTSSVFMGDLNLRCSQYPDAVHPVGRYIDAFSRLRRDPSDFVFSEIVGVPTDLVADPDHLDYDAILADPRMQERVDPASPMPRLVPSCDVPGRGIAFPPRRLVTVARELQARGSRSVVQSICQADFGPAITAIADRIGESVGRVCL